jgi:hypothetical protein
MGTEQKKIILSWFLAAIFMLIVSAWDVAVVAWSVVSHPTVKMSDILNSEPDRLSLRRKEQRYFLDHGLYIPLEDIIVGNGLNQMDKQSFASLAKSCRGLKRDRDIAIWLPLKVRVPFFGERVQEWCWKPDVSS